MISFAKTSRGYSHFLNKLPCQDFSAVYQDSERLIITCCDGHGGESYIRSDIGSAMASRAIINVFSKLDKKMLNLQDSDERIKLLILCEWNRLIDEHYKENLIRLNEVRHLDNDKKEELYKNHVKAYGTTLTGAMVYKDKLVIVGIGDTEVLLLNKGQLVRGFDIDDEPVANITYSMCQDDAYNYLNVRIIDFDTVDGILLCTDGLTSPYQSYTNFSKSFVKPLVTSIIETKSTYHVPEYIDKMAYKLGCGDDVSLAFILKDNLSKYYYST